MASRDPLLPNELLSRALRFCLPRPRLPRLLLRALKESLPDSVDSLVSKETSISADSPPNPRIPERPVLITFISTSSSSTSSAASAISVASSTVFPENFRLLVIFV